MDLSNVHDKRQFCVKEQEQAPFEIIALNDSPVPEPQGNSRGQESENVWSQVF